MSAADSAPSPANPAGARADAAASVWLAVAAALGIAVLVPLAAPAPPPPRPAVALGLVPPLPQAEEGDEPPTHPGPSGRIELTFFQSFDDPRPDAPVRVQIEALGPQAPLGFPREFAALTDAAGRLALALPPGRYRLSASAAGKPMTFLGRGSTHPALWPRSGSGWGPPGIKRWFESIEVELQAGEVAWRYPYGS